MKFRNALVASLAIHSLAMFPFMGPGCSSKGASGSAESGADAPNLATNSGDIAPKGSDEISVEITEGLTQKAPKHAGMPCDGESYGGIGVYLNYVPEARSWVIQDAVAGYPAADAGLSRGDALIFEPGQSDLRGDVGTQVQVKVRKFSGEIVTLTLVRDKICLLSASP